MKIIYLFVLVISSLSISYGQEKSSHTSSRRYITLDAYLKTNNKLTKEDSLNMIEKDGHKLILVEKFDTGLENGISVPYEYKDSTFLALYTKIGFNHRNNKFSDSTTSKYWKQPIKLFFGKSVPNKTKKAFVEFAENIVKQVDSLSLDVVNKVENSNYVIYYSNDYNYESRIENSIYSDYYLHWRRRGSKIYKASIKIREDKLFNEKLRLNKMKSFFISTLGYFSFNNELDCENFFSGCYQENIKLTDFDLEVLKYHYSYGICKGTYLKIFNEQHKKAKQILKEFNTKIGFFHRYK